MTHYGVQKLIVINSGKYEYAVFDMCRPMHLAAPNNRGKSTLVNALQFLYVDDIDHMRFGRSLEDTRRHYFGETPSYLVFECMTPLGLKCMLISGRGVADGSHFKRYVFDGEYAVEVFRDDEGRVVSFDVLRTRLAGRDLSEVKGTRLWEVLGAPRVSQDGIVPRLNILPIRTQVEYQSFRDVFVKLLALTNASDRELRKLIIACHAREIGNPRLDVAAEHKEEFERAETTERRLRFLRSVQQEIDRGRDLLADSAATQERLRKEVSIASGAVHRALALIRAAGSRLEASRGELAARRLNDDAEASRLERRVGGLDEALKGQQLQNDALQRLHAIWTSSSAEMIQTMRDNFNDTQRRHAVVSDEIQRVGRLDATAMMRRAEQLQRDVQGAEHALAHWTHRTYSALRQMKLDDAAIKDVFRLLNPGLLQLSTKDSATIKDRSRLKRNLTGLAALIHEDTYSDESIDLQLGSIPAPDLTTHESKDQLQKELQVLRDELQQAQQRLEVARNVQRAKAALKELEQERDRLAATVGEYDGYQAKWEDRATLESSIRTTTDEKNSLEAAIAELKTRVHTLTEEENANRERVLGLGRMRDNLDKLVSNYNETIADGLPDLRLDLIQPISEDDTFGDLQWEEADETARNAQRLLEGMQKAARALAKSHSALRELEDTIQQRSREAEGQRVYFSEREEEWQELIASRDALSELEKTVEQQWDALFTSLAAKLDQIKRGVRAVSNAAAQINRALEQYRVSNLQSVKLQVVPERDTYDLIESLTSQESIFQNTEELERAKVQMRQWIKVGKVIELESLFGIHISVHELGQERPSHAKSLDEIGSTGTGMTAKAMVFIQLVRAIVDEQRYTLHFYLDETGKLDPDNLKATTSLAVSRGIIPITADPDIRIEPLAHPEVTVYVLGQRSDGKFFINQQRTFHARRIEHARAGGPTNE